MPIKSELKQLLMVERVKHSIIVKRWINVSACVKVSRVIICSSKQSNFILCINYKKSKMNIFMSVCKFSKVNVCISIFVHPSARLSIPSSISPSHRTRNQVAQFTWHFTFRGVCSKICPNNWHLFKSEKNNMQFIWRTKYIHDYLAASLSDL